MFPKHAVRANLDDIELKKTVAAHLQQATAAAAQTMHMSNATPGSTMRSHGTAMSGAADSSYDADEHAAADHESDGGDGDSGDEETSMHDSERAMSAAVQAAMQASFQDDKLAATHQQYHETESKEDYEQ